MEGYIALHRQLIDSAVFANPNHLKIWIWVLLKANFKARSIPVKVGIGYSTVHIERGQFLFGRNTAEEELCLSGSMIYRTMQKFQEWGMILMEVNNQYTVVTVCKYSDYQKDFSKSEQPLNNHRTATEQHLNDIRTTFEQDLNTTNKDNNDNKGGGAEKTPPPVFILDIEASKRRDVVMQQLSTTSLSDSEKQTYLNRIESNSFTKKQGGEFVQLRIDAVRADAEYVKGMGWIKVDATQPDNSIGGYI